MNIYQCLSNIFFQVLSVPASSATCERVFSSAGQVCSKRRGRLSPERIEQLTVLKINQKKVEEFKKIHDITKIDTAEANPYLCGFSINHSDHSDDLEESDLGCLYQDLCPDEEGDEDEDKDEEDDDDEEDYDEFHE